MTDLMQPGEKVVTAVPYRDWVLIFGDRGSVVRMSPGTDLYNNVRLEIIVRP